MKAARAQTLGGWFVRCCLPPGDLRAASAKPPWAAPGAGDAYQAALCEGAGSQGKIDFTCLFVLTLNLPPATPEKQHPIYQEIRGCRRCGWITAAVYTKCRGPSQPGPASLVHGQGLREDHRPRCPSGPADAQGVSESGIMIQGEWTGIRGDRREMGRLAWLRGVHGRDSHRRPAGPGTAICGGISPCFDLFLDADPCSGLTSFNPPSDL